ncbi:MAG: DUF4397 domain-containing protein [Gemmatimonadetes bacterium]|nr:DUF4397 domain-containing protein [Gemmatimonadota bacterium]
MRPTARLAHAALLATLLAPVLLAGCSPRTDAPTGGSPGSGTGGGVTNDKGSTISFYHLLMTSNAPTSTVAFKANGAIFGAGTTYLGSALDNSVAWASSTPLVPFEVTDGGTTRFLAVGRLLTNGYGHSAIAIGVIGSTDPNLQPTLVVAVKDSVNPGAGNARVRWLHNWPGVAAVDIWSGNPGFEVRVVQNLAYGQITAYSDITAATSITSLHVVVTPAGVARGVADLTNISAITQITTGNTYLVPLIHTSSNFASPGSRSLAIYQER